MNTSKLLYSVLLILPLISTTLAGEAEFDLAQGKIEVLGILKYLSTKVTLQRNYADMETAINGTADFKSFMNIARNNTLKTADVDALKGIAAKQPDALYNKIKTYKDNFWNLLDQAGLDGSNIPMQTRLNTLLNECNYYRKTITDANED